MIYLYVKKTGISGLIILYAIFFFEKTPTCPGLSAEGLFFFSLGAYFSINKKDFSDFFKRHWRVETCMAIPFLIVMVLSYGNQLMLWNIARKGFTLFGCSSTIGIVALLFERKRLKVNQTLSNSSFFIFAAHARTVLSVVEGGLAKIIPSNQLGMIVGYFLEATITVAVLVLCYNCLKRWIPKTLSFITGGR